MPSSDSPTPWSDKRNPRTMRLHEFSIAECVETLAREDRHAFDAVKRAGPRLTRIIEAITPGILAGGRLLYLADGTVARLASLDAAELPEAFHIAQSPVQFIEFTSGAAPDSLLAPLQLSPRDTILALAAREPSHQLAALLAAARALPGASKPLTALITCATTDSASAADLTLVLKTGPEVITGAFHRKAGTALKLALNIISTTLMVQLGMVYENLVVNPHPDPLSAPHHALHVVATLTQLSPEASQTLLSTASGCARTAVIMHRMNLPPEAASARLSQASGRLDLALAPHLRESED